MSRVKLAVGLGIGALEIAVLAWVFFGPPVRPDNNFAGFMRVCQVNPKTHELNKAFALYRKDTGQEPSAMSYDDIVDYTTRIRNEVRQ